MMETESSLNYTDADRYQWAAYYDGSSGSIRPVTVNDRERAARQRLLSRRRAIATLVVVLGLAALAWFGGSGKP